MTCYCNHSKRQSDSWAGLKLSCLQRCFWPYIAQSPVLPTTFYQCDSPCTVRIHSLLLSIRSVAYEDRQNKNNTFISNKKRHNIGTIAPKYCLLCPARETHTCHKPFWALLINSHSVNWNCITLILNQIFNSQILI